MSRIGRKPIEVPSGVKVSLEGRTVKVEGPKGKLAWEFPSEVAVEVKAPAAGAKTSTVVVTRTGESAQHSARHGLTRALIANMVVGAAAGYEKRLEIVGVGYRAQLKGKTVSLSVGFSHTVEVEPLAGVTVTVPEPTRIIVTGIDKQAVGQMAALLRGVRPPEPYKGKGIRYEGEAVRRKAGKAFVSSGA